MKVASLGSGSRGNGVVLVAGDRALLVDCGFGPRATAQRLQRLGIAPESIVGLVLTHEHQDHAQGAAQAQHKWRWPVFGTPGTLGALRGIPAKWLRPLPAGGHVDIEGFGVDSVAIPHDAADPIAVAVTLPETGARVVVAHDLGAVPPGFHALCERADLLCVEANHDVAMLRDGPYPPMLQQRIRGGRGHLSNAATAALAAALAHRALQRVLLLHLSETNNTPQLAEDAVRSAVRRAGWSGTVSAAPGRAPAILFNGVATRDRQLSLSL